MAGFFLKLILILKLIFLGLYKFLFLYKIILFKTVAIAINQRTVYIHRHTHTHIYTKFFLTVPTYFCQHMYVGVTVLSSSPSTRPTLLTAAAWVGPFKHILF